MSRRIGPGILVLGLLGLAFSCSSPSRKFNDGAGGTGANSGEAGASSGATAGAAPTSAGAAGASPAQAEGGEAGMSNQEAAGAAGAPSSAGGPGTAGAGGAAGGCQPNQSRPCSDDGALGPCGAGTETCAADGTWGACSVKPAAKDTCERDNDDNCNGIVNEGCPCVAGSSRSCKDAGALGKCATGTQSCTVAGVWGGCSIVPAAKDGCTTNQDDETCNGTPNEGCTCVMGATRTCAQAGLVGKCAATGAIETCSAAGVWGPCSVAPSAADTCAAGNNDNCTGAANEGCQCINGVTTKPCGPCNDGKQTCTDGKTNTYGTCVGAVLQPTTYYRDADGDGFGSAATTTTCGGPPAGYTDQSGDCCDDGGDLAVAKTIFPGQPLFFSASTAVCNIGWNYNCSANGSIETSPAVSGGGCNANDVYPSCTGGPPATPVSSTRCGLTVGECGCSAIDKGPGGTDCETECGSYKVSCH